MCAFAGLGMWARWRNGECVARPGSSRLRAGYETDWLWVPGPHCLVVPLSAPPNLGDGDRVRGKEDQQRLLW